MITIREMKDGRLKITADNEARQYIADKLHDGRGYWSIWAELIEPYSCNGSYTHFDAGQGNPFVGLTGAPCIAESMSYPDSGDLEVDGKLWYFDRYMLECDLRQLKNTGRVYYDAAPGNEES
jgi:hypothetical protein